MKTLILVLSLFTYLSFIPSAVQAQRFLEIAGLDPRTQYQKLETEHFKLIYPPHLLVFSQKAAIHLEHAHRILSPLFQWTPRSKTTVVVADNEDNANGFAMASLRVGMVLIATPPDTWNSTSHTDDWIKLLTFHEYTHMLNLDPTTGFMEALRILFGDVIRPNGLLPIWMLEGLAVYFETRTSPLGRGRSPYWDGILRAYLKDGRLGTDTKNAMTLDRVNGDYPFFPGGETPYLFGYHLWNQFSKDTGKYENNDVAMGELSIRSAGRVPFFIEGNLDNVMQKSWSDYWDAFITESDTRLTGQIKTIEKAGVTLTERFIESNYSATAGSFSPNGEWVAYSEIRTDDRARLVLKEIKSGKRIAKEEKLSGVGISFSPDSRYVIYSALTRDYGYHLYSELFYHDLKNDQETQLTHHSRAKDPSLSPDGKKIVFVHTENATHHLKIADVIYSDNGIALKNEKTLYSPKEFSILGNPKFSSNTEIIFSKQEIGSVRSDLEQISVTGQGQKTLLSDGFLNRYPIKSANDIYFISNRSGVENIHRLDRGKSVQVSNVITGASFPFFSPNGELYANLMSSNGYQISKFKLDSQTTYKNETIAGASAPVPLIESKSDPNVSPPNQTEPYSALSSLAPRQWAPLAYASGNSYAGTTVGGMVLGFDSTGKHQYVLGAAYNTKPKTVDGLFQYSLYTGRPILDFYAVSETTNIASDLLGREYRRNSTAEITASYPLFWVRSSLTPSIYAFSNWRKIYNLSSGSSIPVNDFQYQNPFVPGVGASLKFSNARSTKLGFMPEMGHDLSLSGEERINTQGSTSFLRYLASWTHYVGLGAHTVLKPKLRWIGNSRAPESIYSATEVLGKDSSNVLDRGNSTSLSKMTLRGYSDTSRFARFIGVGSLDFHFPVAKGFFGFGDTFPAFIKQAHGYVFGDAALLPQNGIDNKILPAFGGGLSLDTTLFIRAPLTFNVEYHNGTNKSQGGASLVFFSIQSANLF